MSKLLPNVYDYIHIRLFQESDGEMVRSVYVQAMMTGPSSPTYQALKAQRTHPWALYFYVQIVVGFSLATWGSPAIVRSVGIFLVVSALALLYAWRRDIRKIFEDFTQAAVDGDLADVNKSYSTPGSGFWVAELTSGVDAGKVVGCVGLDSSISPEHDTAELRHMSVLPGYQGHGIGTNLLSTLLRHARNHNLATVTLNTSMYQMTAIRMYEAAGFKEVQRVVHIVRFLFITTVATVHFYALSLQ